MRGAWLAPLALVLVSLECVVAKIAGSEVTHIDVCVVLIVHLAIRSSTGVGAVTSFVIGYLLDVMTGRPSGLFPALGVTVFLLARAGAQVLESRTRTNFAAFCVVSSIVHSLLASLLTWLTSKSGDGRAYALSGLPVQVILTGLTALALYPLLVRIEPGDQRRSEPAGRFAS
jgi:rod shape-determining protein MreD